MEAVMADDHKYHIDHHGSLVRPAELLAARASGDAQILAAAETEAVAAVSHALRRLGLSAMGDGQFRREHFESVVYDRVGGFGPASGTQPLADAARIPAVRRRTAPDDPRPAGHLAQLEVALVLASMDRPVFIQLPSPGYLAAVGSALAAAADVDAVLARGAGLAAVLRSEIEALADEAVAYVALENPLYPPLLTVAGREQLTAAGLDVDAVLSALLETDRAAVEGLRVPDTFRIGLDLTDSGPLPTTQRGYDPAAVDALLDEFPFHRLCVDFPADPGARLPLERVKPGVVLSLGVVDVSVPAPEDVEDLLARLDPVIDERTEDDVAIATNGGFAQSARSPLMSPQEQNAKLRLVETVARYYWGNEI
jgi:methionine synthase II (cobalamin-independent)